MHPLARALCAQIRILRGIRHPNVLRLVEVYETPAEWFLLSELLEGGELFDRICAKSYYRESEARDLVAALLTSVAYLHDLGVVHRDLKPEK